METVLDEVCASCGSSRVPDGSFCLFCGDVLTEPSSPAVGARSASKRVANAADNTEYAGFWLRFWAGAFDVCVEVAGASLLTAVIYFALSRYRHLMGLSSDDFKFAVGYAFVPILAVGSWLYCAFAESSSWRATVGKRLLGLQVMNIDGRRVSFGQATVRHFMKFLSFFCLMIGFLMAGWTKRRQGLHDIPTDCLVIRVPPRNFSLLA